MQVIRNKLDRKKDDANTSSSSVEGKITKKKHLSDPKTVSYDEKKKAAEEYSAANNTNSDDVKYKMAVETARNKLKDAKDVTDREMKIAIDNELKSLGSKKSGSEMRGDNAFTKALDGMRGFIDDATLAGGEGINWFVDNVVATPFEWLGNKNVAKNIRESFDGKDFQSLADAGADIGLSLLGPGGWTALLLKNAIQQSDNIMEGLSGKDRITLENLDDGQGAAKVLEGIGGTALAAIPAVGKVRNIATLAKGKGAAKSIADDAVKEASKAAKAADASDKAAKKTVEKTEESVADAIADVGAKANKAEQAAGTANDAIVSEALMLPPGREEAAKVASNAANDAVVSEALMLPPGREEATRVASKAANATSKKSKAASKAAKKEATKKASKEADDVVEAAIGEEDVEAAKEISDAIKSTFGKVINPIRTGKIDRTMADNRTQKAIIEKLKKKNKSFDEKKHNKRLKRVGRGLANATATGVLGPGLSTFSSQAVREGSHGDEYMDQIDKSDIAQPAAPQALAALANAFKRTRQVGVTGKYGAIASAIPAAALAMANANKQTDRMYERTKKSDGMTDADIMAALKVR